ncbi:hypothetical protein MLD38_009150 [Melastoma candidum]|uniref:Uncharacterized protein n=1 Tax=Melastoma candidum TaxID=119954 RepID=A0ACB9RWK2_9MYRT|nr:hypothetical protein MLD38_009150 [Melastoma candidum]
MEFSLDNPLSCFGEPFPIPRECDREGEALCSLFLMEKNHMPCSDYVPSLRNGDFDVSIRQDAVSSLSQLSSGFDPQLRYLAINYLDRFLSCQGVESIKQPWASRLLAVSCLSLATKMLKVELPLSLIQVKGGLVYDLRTVHRMEAVVLGALGWRMRSATPLSFISFFASQFKTKDPPSRQALRAWAVKIILKSQSDVELLRFKPSIIAASALLLASHELFPIKFHSFRTAIFGCSYVNKEELMECYSLMQATGTEGYGSAFTDDDNNDTSNGDTPINVLDQQFSTSSWSYGTSIGNAAAAVANNRMATASSSSSKSSSSGKRRKISI